MNYPQQAPIDLSQFRTLEFDGQAFTPEAQAAIIDNAFNGTGTFHSKVMGELSRMTSQPQVPEIPNNLPQPQSEPDDETTKLRALLNNPQFAGAVLQVLAGNPPVVPNTPPVTPVAQPTAPPVQQETPQGDDWLKSLFSNEPQANNANVQPEQQQQAPNVPPQTNQNQPNDYSNVREILIGTAVNGGVDPNDFVNFVSSISDADYLEMYKAYKAGNAPAQPQPQPPPMPTEPKSLLNLRPANQVPLSGGYPSNRAPGLPKGWD